MFESTCRVCGRGLTTGAERKLRRHLECEATYDEAVWEALRAWLDQRLTAAIGIELVLVRSVVLGFSARDRRQP